jgi:predicted metal-dependent hydrolase
MDDRAALSEMLTLASGSVPVVWRRSQRARRISLRIDPKTASVVVTLPMRAARGAGIALLTTHQDWAAGKLAALPKAAPFADGSVIPLHGVPHTIRHMPGARGAAWARDGEIQVAGRPEFLSRRVLDFLRAEARLRLSGLALAKAQAAGLAYTRLTIKDTSSRWGSCASNGSLAFSWRLVMAPPEVQDYVAAHEVAHLRHMNHGRRFWVLVRELTPHADVAMPWLHEHGARLLRVG